jgi:hypothetical protein
VVFFDEVDAIGGARFEDGAGGDNEVQRTMLEIVNQLDGFDSRGNVKVGSCEATGYELEPEVTVNQLVPVPMAKRKELDKQIKREKSSKKLCPQLPP